MNDEYLHPLLFLFSIIVFFILHYINIQLKTRISIFSLFHCIISLTIVFFLFICKYIPSIPQLKTLSLLDKDTIITKVIEKYVEKQKKSDMIKKILKYSVIFTMGYSIHDIFHGVYEKRYDFILHGILLLIACIFMYEYTIWYPYVLFTEISTLFFNFVHTKNRYVVIAFIISFFICRIIYYPYLLYNSFTSYNTTITIKTLLFLAFLLNYYWFYYIIKKTYNVFIKSKK